MKTTPRPPVIAGGMGDDPVGLDGDEVAPEVARSIRQATTGLRVSALNRRSSSAMTSQVVTLPPGLLIRSTTAATPGSRAAASSLSRNDARGLSPTAYRLP